MQHPFTALAPEYAALLAAMRVRPERIAELDRRAATVLDLAHAHRDEWADVEARTGVPRLWGIASFERESGSDYSRSAAQGDRWDRVSVNVPRGLGPYRSWADACAAAYHIDRLDAVCAAGWTWPRACYEGELYNGFGPRRHGRRTGYLWAWTNVYDGGKYIADGRWSPSAMDEQCGMAPMMAALAQLDPSLKFIDAPPAPAPAGAAPPRPAIPAVFDGEVGHLQVLLNAAGAKPPVTVDGSYGRETRRAVADFQESHGLAVDGIAGPLTWGALQLIENTKPGRRP